MTDWTNNGYQWFQVAELTYDSSWSATRADRDVHKRKAPEHRLRGLFYCEGALLVRMAEVERRQIDLRNFDLHLVRIDRSTPRPCSA